MSGLFKVLYSSVVGIIRYMFSVSRPFLVYCLPEWSHQYFKNERILNAIRRYFTIFMEEKQSKKCKRKLKSLCSSEAGKISKQRPNYFIGMRIPNIQIHSSVGKVQEHIIEQEPKLKLASISLPTLHITIMAFYLNESEDMQKVIESMDSCQDILQLIMEKPLNLKFEGLSHFQNKVLFVKLKEDDTLESLKRIFDILKSTFERNGITVSDKCFKPHLTIMKLSRNAKLKKAGVKKIKESYYTDFLEEDFGNQTVTSLELLSMTKPKDNSGYYHCCHQLNFDTISEKCPISSNLENTKSSDFIATTEVKKHIREKFANLTKIHLDPKEDDCS